MATVGLRSPGLSLTNLLVHIASCLLLWAILRQLAIGGAFLAALLFAVHPLNVESVAWISQRKGLLALVFFLLSILWYVKEEDRRDADVRAGPAGFRAGKYYWLSFLAFLLALLSKGSVAILPVILLGIIVWRRPLSRWDFARMTPFLVAAIALAVVNVWCQNRLQETPFRTANFLERSVGAGAVVWFYLSKAVAPIDLAFVYPQWHIQTDKLLWWLPLLAALAVTAVLWRQRSNRLEPAAAVGLGLLLRGAGAGAGLRRRGVHAIFAGRRPLSLHRADRNRNARRRRLQRLA